MSLAARVNVSANDRLYTIAPDDPAPAVALLELLIGAAIVDELTDLAPAIGLSATSDAIAGEVVLANGGLLGLVGTAFRIFPRLAVQSYRVNFQVQAKGFIDLDFTVGVPAGSTLPIGAAPVPQFFMHRAPIVLGGRVARMVSGQLQPVAGASVTVTGYWRQAPPAYATVPATTTNFISLAPQLYADRPAASATLDVLTLTPVVGSDQPLLMSIDAGATAIALPTSIGISAGDVLVIGADVPERAETMAVASAAPGVVSVGQTNVNLALPTIWAHRRGTTVRKVTVGAPTVSHPVTLDAQRGDACVFLNNLTGLSATQTVRMRSGGLPDGFHQASLLAATSDANGFYRLPPLTRAAQVRIDAKLTTPSLTGEQIIRVDYSGAEDQLDFVIS
jgi:hypothetical protein